MDQATALLRPEPIHESAKALIAQSLASLSRSITELEIENGATPEAAAAKAASAVTTAKREAVSSTPSSLEELIAANGGSSDPRGYYIAIAITTMGYVGRVIPITAIVAPAATQSEQGQK